MAVEMSKKCTPLWREAHFEVKMHKAHQVRTIFGNARKPSSFCSLFDQVHNPLRRPSETTSECPTVFRTPGVFNILTSTCASCHNGVPLFDISTSKSGPSMVCFVHFDVEMCLAPQRRFVHFDFEMCFAPQRRALFRHLNFQKWSGPGVFCTF